MDKGRALHHKLWSEKLTWAFAFGSGELKELKQIVYGF